MGAAKQRRTFVAVSFRTKNRRPESAFEIVCVHYKDDKQVGNPARYGFRPLKGVAKNDSSVPLFDEVFDRVRPLLTNLDLPVIVWDDFSRRVLDALILENDIPKITHSPRYFLLKNYAIRRIDKATEDWSFNEIAEELKLPMKKVDTPDAEQIARMMLRIEDMYEFPAGVARAFCAFCGSIMDDDNRIDLKEAVELRSLVELLMTRYYEFADLKKELDNVLQDGIVNEEESGHLMRILTNMREYYGKFAENEKRV